MFFFKKRGYGSRGSPALQGSTGKGEGHSRSSPAVENTVPGAEDRAGKQTDRKHRDVCMSDACVYVVTATAVRTRNPGKLLRG